MRGVCIKLVDNFEAILFDDRIGENVLGDALELRLRLVPAPAIEIQHKEFSLAHVLHLRIAQARERIVNGFTLRIENGAFWHYPHVCFHDEIIALPAAAASRLTERLARPSRERNARSNEVAARRVSSSSLKPIACAWAYSPASDV